MAEAATQPFPGSRRLDSVGYALVWTGAMALLLVPETAPQLVFAFCLVIAPSRFLGRATLRSAGYRTAWRLITLAFLILSLVDWYWNKRPFQQTFAAQLCFLQAYKAYNYKDYSDYLAMAFFAALMVVFAGVVSESVFFLAAVVPFVALLVTFLLTLNLSRQYLARRPRTASRLGGRGPLPFGYQVAHSQLDSRNLAISKSSGALQTAVILLMGTAFFYIIPREHISFPSHFSNTNVVSGRDPVTGGLSSGVSLRHLSAIKNDPRPAVRVAFEGKMPSPGTVYLRSGALERLSNLEWRAVQPRPRMAKPDQDGRYWLQQIDPADQPLLIAHEVEFLNAPGEAPLALPGLVAIDRIEIQPPESQIALVGQLTGLRRYRALSWGGPGVRKTPLPEENELVLSESLRLPPELANSRIYALASEIAYGRSSHLESAKAIEQYLRGHYAYTLHIESLNGPIQGPGPIEQFLFEERQGNCEVFASAMAVLCRNLQIPARLVIGYHGGIQRDSPREIIFRNQDAHAWVEVWSPEFGWTTFDPTPPPPLEVYSGRFSFKKLVEWFNAATARWNRLVVWYDRETKERWMAYLWQPVDRWASEGFYLDQTVAERLLPRMRQNITRPQVIVLLAALIALNAVAATVYLQARRRWLKRRRRRATAIRRADPWHKFYRSVVAVMQGRLGRRQPFQTPSEFLEALAQSHSLDPLVVRPIVDLYHRGRFGNAPWNDHIAHEADALLRHLVRVVRAS
jgi:transglutaminase-like putative cysteine protease